MENHISQSFLRPITTALCGLLLAVALAACATTRSEEIKDPFLHIAEKKIVSFPDDLDAATLSLWKGEDATFREIMERKCANFEGNTNICMDSVPKRIEKIRMARATCWEVRDHEEGLRRCTAWSDHYRKCLLEHVTDYAMQCPSIETFLPVNPDE